MKTILKLKFTVVCKIADHIEPKNVLFMQKQLLHNMDIKVSNSIFKIPWYNNGTQK